MKPKPFTAVRSNGCGSAASSAAADRLTLGAIGEGREVDPDRAADAEPDDGPRDGGRGGDGERGRAADRHRRRTRSWPA